MSTFLIFYVGIPSVMLGAALMATFGRQRKPVVAPPGTPLDTEILDRLEAARYNLFYNTDLNAWGVLGGSDKFICTGLTVRSALLRAPNVLADRENG